MWDSEEIIQELKKRRKRITEQRRVMIDVIAEGDCRSFKELYVKVAKKIRPSARQRFTGCFSRWRKSARLSGFRAMC